MAAEDVGEIPGKHREAAHAVATAQHQLADAMIEVRQTSEAVELRLEQSLSGLRLGLPSVRVGAQDA